MRTNVCRHGVVVEAGAFDADAVAAGALEGAAEDAEVGDASFPVLLGFAEDVSEPEAEAAAGDALVAALADADAGALALAVDEGAALLNVFGAADDVLVEGVGLVV